MSESSQQIQMIDDSGLLAIVDTQAYPSFIAEDWTYEQILEHFSQQMAAKTILVWDCGDGGDDYLAEVRSAITNDRGFREAFGVIEAAGTRLHIASYTALTMAAQFDDEKLPSRNEINAAIDVQPGTYRVRLVQCYDPAEFTERQRPNFIVELELGEGPSWNSVQWIET